MRTGDIWSRAGRQLALLGLVLWAALGSPVAARGEEVSPAAPGRDGGAPVSPGDGGDQESLGSELKFVVLVFRHGDRTPINPYPNDPYGDESHWPVGFGELTPIGKMMQYNLGKYLRQRYGHLLGDLFNEKVIYIRSTDVDRTLMSAQSNLAGLYPPQGNQVWNPNLAWQPIPVHTEPTQEDNLIFPHAFCRQRDKLVADLQQSEEVQALYKKYAWVLDYLTKHSGVNVTDMVQVNYLYDTLFIEQLYNKTLPEWTKKVFPEKMQYLHDLSFIVNTWTHELRRLSGGPFVDNVVKSFRKVERAKMDPPQRRMLMYSGHDTTVSAVLNTLGLFSPPMAPPYASTVLFELHQEKEKGEHFVRIFYRNDTSRSPYLMTLPGCEQDCPLAKFDRLTRDLRPNDWQQECQNDKTEDPVIDLVTLVSLSICITLLLLFLMVSVIGLCIKFRRAKASELGIRAGDEGYFRINEYDQ